MGRNQVTEGQIDSALLDLLHEIACGREYPDAEWLVSRSAGVPAETLREAYDTHCGARKRYVYEKFDQRGTLFNSFSGTRSYVLSVLKGKPWASQAIECADRGESFKYVPPGTSAVLIVRAIS